MEAPRGLGGRRTLLPFEVQLIDQLGITVEEYWQFNDAALERLQERKQGYELVPEIYSEANSYCCCQFGNWLGINSSGPVDEAQGTKP